MRRKNNILLGLLLAGLTLGMLFAQEPAPEEAPDVLEAAQAEEAGRQEEGQVLADDDRLDIGMLPEYGRLVEDPSGKVAELIRDKFGGSEIHMKEDVTDIPVFLQGFLANRKDMRMAEVDPGKLQALADEFGMMEEDMTKFKEAKESGKWQNVDVFVRGRFALNKYNMNEVHADLSFTGTGEKYTAIASRLQYNPTMYVAKNLANNIEDIILASSPAERKMLSEIQFHKAKVDAANQSPEVQMITLAAGTAGLLTGLFGFTTDRPMLGVVSSLYGIAGWGAWILQRNVAGENREEYSRLTKKYNETYGDKYAD